MDQTTAKRILNELIKREDLKNKNCADCGNPNPQWASVSFAIFICLQCAGHHRGYGVHISFVRSVSMDTWSEDQIKRMQLGGNGPFKDFVRSYPSDQSGYTEGMEPYATYHSWAATEYRAKLDADLAGKPWSPSSPPAGTETPSAPAQGLRKSRASGRSATGNSLRSNSGSPASFAQSGSPGPMDQKSQNEAYFSSLGNMNASRPDNLPPSQGGKYQGFGSTPAPDMSSSSASYGLTSRDAPSLSDFQDNPVAALGKGWSLFSSVVASATRTVNEAVIQPSVERVLDPEFQASVKGYASEATKKAAQVGSVANEWGKTSLGVDVAGQVTGVAGQLGGTMGWGGRSNSGYGSLSQQHDSSYHDSSYHDEDEDDLFDNFQSPSSNQHTGAGSMASSTSAAPAASAKKEDEWGDEWKDF